MAKKLGMILLFIAFGSGAIAYTALQTEDNQQASVQSATPTPQTPGTDPQTQQPAAEVDSEVTGTYVDYSDEALANAEGQKVLFFHAPWCPQCRQIESDIETQGAPNGYTIIKVDYDSNQELRAKYGVRLQTTLVKIDDSNEKIDDYVAYNEPTLEALKRDYL